MSNRQQVELALIAPILLILLVASSVGAQDWVGDFGGSSVTITRAVTTDSSGNAYAVGTFSGTTTIGTSNLVSAGGNDIFLTSYDPQGNFLWAKRYGSTGNETPTTIVLDAAGSIYVAGVFTATANFGGTNVVALGSAGGFIAKYSSTGNFVWSQAINSTNFAHANGIALNTAQNAIALAGDYQGSVTVTSTNTFVSASGGEDSFLAQYNTTNGFAIWGKTWGSLDFDSAQAIFFDHSDNLIVAGTFAFQINFGSVTIQSYPTTRDFYAVKFPASGTVAPGNATWAKEYGTLHDTILTCATLDPNGNLTLAGHFATSSDIGTGVLNGTGSLSGCVGSYSSSDGSAIWTKVLNSTVTLSPNNLSYNALGQLSVCGHFVNIADVGGITLVGANLSTQQAFCSQYDITGNALNARAFVGTGANGYDALGCCNFGSATLVVGYLSGICNFGFTSLTASGTVDGYLVRFDTAAGKQYYVRTDGNDSFTGLGNDPGHAWKTEAHAAAVAVSNDTVNVQAGFYNERVKLTTASCQGVIWIGTWKGTQPTTTNLGFQIGDVGAPINNVTTMGFCVRNTNTFTSFNEQDCSGIYVSGNKCLVQSNDCSFSPLAGIFLESRTNSNGCINGASTIRYNTCLTNGLAGIVITGTNVECISNIIGNSVQFGVYCLNTNLSLDADGGLFFGWNIHWLGNTILGANWQSPQNPTAHCDGLQTYGPSSSNPMGYTTNTLIERNFFNGYYPGSGGQANGAALFSEEAIGTRYFNNVILWHKGFSHDHTNRNTKIYYNTIANLTNDALANPSAITLVLETNTDIQANLLYNNPTGQVVLTTVGSILSSNNMEYTTKPLVLDSSYSSFVGNDFWGTNPLVVNFVATNFALSSSSPARNKGTVEASVTNDFMGVARPPWDIGALVNPSPFITQHPLSTSVFVSQTALFSITVAGNAPLTYAWQTNGVAAGTNGPVLSVGPTVLAWSGMTILCVITDVNGLSVTSATATLTVAPDPVILTQPQNATVGVGSTATFTVVVTNQNAVTYQWSKNGSAVGGATSSAYTTPATIAADNNSQFFVVATDSFGSVQSANATLTVTNIVSPPDPVITSQPQSTNIYTSQSALFQLTATGGSTLTYAWQTNGVAAGTNGPALSLGPCPTIWSGMAVLCVVSDLAGSVTSSIATLTVSPDPVITSQPANATAVAGATASFFVSATGQTALTFQWYRNGGFVSGANSSGYTTPPLTSSNNGDTYNAVVTDTAGSLTSANATLTVTSPPPTNNVGKITNAHIGKAHIGP